MQCKKANNAKYSKTELPGSAASYNTWSENKMGLFYNAPKPTYGTFYRCPISLHDTHKRDPSLYMWAVYW